jgi:hypothetical protein
MLMSLRLRFLYRLIKSAKFKKTDALIGAAPASTVKMMRLLAVPPGWVRNTDFEDQVAIKLTTTLQ